jgi:hypothetical protein
MVLHHLMIGTWTPPGAIFTVEFDDEAKALKLVKKTSIPHDEPISWMTFSVSFETITRNCLAQPFLFFSMIGRIFMVLR